MSQLLNVTRYLSLGDLKAEGLDTRRDIFAILTAGGTCTAYLFDPASSATADDVSVIMPDVIDSRARGRGRWLVCAL